MSSYTFVDTTGVIVPDTATLRDDVAAEWREALGQTLVTTPDTPQGVLITAETLARESVANNNAMLANQINPNIAGGVFLDAICALLGLERRSATATRVSGCVLAGVPGTLIPAGSRARSAAGDIFATVSSVSIGFGGSVTTDMQAIVTGPVVCPVDALNEVLDMVLGWETVTNPQPGVTGSDRQSDVSLRELRRNTLARQGISTREAQLSALNDIPDVSSAVFRENYTAVDAIIDGINLKRHSVWACVDGGSDEAVAASLLENKTDGAAWNGAVLVAVTDPHSGQAYNVLFDRAEHVPVFVTITLSVGADVANPTTAVPQAVAAWSRGEIAGDPGLTIGVPVSPFEVGAAVNFYHPGYRVTSVLLSVSGGVPGAASIPITLRQRAIIDPSYVSVIVS